VEPGFFERDNVGIAKEERRRLLYVGMTRAQKGLFISYARRRYGRQRYADPTSLSPIKGPSVFVQEICNHCRIRPVNATEFLKDFLSQKNT
jgi:superfamily I DNA/RNA helicase